MVLDDEAKPLTRSWCLFELLQTFQLEDKRKGEYQGLLYCTDSGVMNTGRASFDASIALARKLSALKVQDATASKDSDKKMIDSLIEIEGGFDHMNEYLR